MLIEDQRLRRIFKSDSDFDRLYPLRIQAKADRHWTPLEVARCAASFLVPGNGVHVLDIGSGVGKFCLAAAEHKTHALFYGVEQRKDLVDYANACNNKLDLFNVFFIHCNFTQIDFRQFDHFYFYNSFYENLNGTDKIDHSIDHSLPLYNYYNRYLYKQFESKPRGTRIVTYHSLENEMPPNYHLVNTAFNSLLKFWTKV